MAQLETGCTGLIKSVKPVMKDGEHETWENPKGVTFYKFWVEIGDKKSKKPLLSPDTEPWWAKPGIAVQYTLETLPDGKYNFSEIKKPDSQEAKQAHIKEAYKDKPFVSTYNDPVNIHRFAKAESYGFTIWLFGELPFEPPTLESIMTNSQYLYNWIIQDASSKDAVLTRVACLRSAIKCINAGKENDSTGAIIKTGWLSRFMPEPEKMTTKLIRLADEFYKDVCQITKESLEK